MGNWNASYYEDMSAKLEKRFRNGVSFLTTFIYGHALDGCGSECPGMRSSQFIAKPRQQPFFLYTALNAVHYPMHAPPKYVDRFPNLPKERQMYAAMLSAADDAIGRMLAALERAGQTSNTLICLLGDNGATTERRAGLNQQIATAGKNGVFRGYKFSTFDGGMHVPGLVCWPGQVPAGKKIKEVVMTADLFPTLCGLASATENSDAVARMQSTKSQQ